MPATSGEQHMTISAVVTVAAAVGGLQKDTPHPFASLKGDLVICVCMPNPQKLGHPQTL